MNKHLTDQERETIRQIATRENLRDIVLLIAGIVAHDVEDYAKALDASDLIRKAAVTIS